MGVLLGSQASLPPRPHDCWPVQFSELREGRADGEEENLLQAAKYRGQGGPSPSTQHAGELGRAGLSPASCSYLAKDNSLGSRSFPGSPGCCRHIWEDMAWWRA